MGINKNNLLIFEVASSNKLDSAYHVVRIEEDGTSVASNGRRVVCVSPVPIKIKYPNNGKVLFEPINLPIDLVKEVAKNIPKMKFEPDVHICKEVITISDKTFEKHFSVTESKTAFPSWRKVFFLIQTEPIIPLSVNRKDLLQVIKTLEKVCPDKSGETEVEIYVNQKGLIIRAQNKETGQKTLSAIQASEIRVKKLNKWEKEILNYKPKLKKKKKKKRRIENG